MNIKFFSSLFLMLLAFSVFVGVFQQSANAWEAKVKYFVACKNVDESKRPPIPIDVSTVFSTNDEKIHLFIYLEDVTGPIKITIKLFKPDGTLFDEVDSGWYKEKYNWVTFYPWVKISEIQNLIGEWRAEAYLNGKLASTLKFMLSPASEIKIIGRSMSLVEGEPFYIGDILTIKYTLRNEGATTAKNIVFKFEDITPSKGLIVIEASPPKDLSPGESGEWIIKIKAETPGEYTAVLRLYESDSKIIEGNWQITVSLPELQIIEKKISPSEEEPFYVGDVATLIYTIKNNGEGKVKGVKVYVELPDGLKLVSASPAKDLMPKEEGEWIIKIKAEKPGDYKGKIILSVMDAKIAEGELTVKALSKPASSFIGILTIAIIALIIIAVIAVIFMKKKKAASSKALEPSTPQINKRFCVKCGAEIPIDAKYCLKCGATQ
ncbi:MAG: zinc-ribbon domain-containing protein [Candidatus Bathyarchaeia archaeon]